jgi:hypothetical protein
VRKINFSSQLNFPAGKHFDTTFGVEINLLLERKEDVDGKVWLYRPELRNLFFSYLQNLITYFVSYLRIECWMGM